MCLKESGGGFHTAGAIRAPFIAPRAHGALALPLPLRARLPPAQPYGGGPVSLEKKWLRSVGKQSIPIVPPSPPPVRCLARFPPFLRRGAKRQNRTPSARVPCPSGSGIQKRGSALSHANAARAKRKKLQNECALFALFCTSAKNAL